MDAPKAFFKIEKNPLGHYHTFKFTNARIQNPGPQLGREMSERSCFLQHVDTARSARFTKLISSSKCQTLQIGAATGLERSFRLGFAYSDIPIAI